ncbi:hypothetical protein BpHYR1_050046 [Brachionus plicatilis]|uniref:Uncharacterized protein n=1 Tax=Brachionus plicatilis TaxID=10195 RepID=A0A3M7S3E6_BRAPC|nr:hypothetical protein BpHYR1_050046 [Brachionus plicatilis]
MIEDNLDNNLLGKLKAFLEDCDDIKFLSSLEKLEVKTKKTLVNLDSCLKFVEQKVNMNQANFDHGWPDIKLLKPMNEISMSREISLNNLLITYEI